MKRLICFFLVLISNTANADYILYDKTTGEVLAVCSGVPILANNQDYMKVVGHPSDAVGKKKIVLGSVVDRDDVGRKITVTGDTELTAANNVSTTLTIRLMDRNGVLLTGFDRDLKITTTRGKLGKIKAKTASGETTVTFRGVDETIECIIIVSDPADEFTSAVHKITLVP